MHVSGKVYLDTPGEVEAALDRRIDYSEFFESDHGGGNLLLRIFERVQI